MFQWVLGTQTNGGSEVGESFYATSLVKENDPRSWVAAWTTVARQVEQRAAAGLAAGHAVSAREAYLRAYVYNRAALAFINPFDADVARPAGQHAVDCFRRSAALADPAAEPVSVPSGGVDLPGYFVAPHDVRANRKTLIMIGGGDTYVEDLYLIIGPAAIKRPQPADRGPSRPGRAALRRAVHAARHREPDPGGGRLRRGPARGGRRQAGRLRDQLRRVHSAWGSVGGTADPGHGGLQRSFRLPRVDDPDADGRAVRQEPGLAPGERDRQDAEPQAEPDPARHLRLALGAKRYVDMLDIAKNFTLDPARITCPLLSIVGEKEYANSTVSRRFQDDAVKANRNPQSRLIVVKTAGGGDAHAMGTNLSLMAQLVSDWPTKSCRRSRA
jgi:hypothetical protein